MNFKVGSMRVSRCVSAHGPRVHVFRRGNAQKSLCRQSRGDLFKGKCSEVGAPVSVGSDPKNVESGDANGNGNGNGTGNGSGVELTLEVVSAINKVSQEEWDACASASGEVNPFLLWEFLNALEESGSAVRTTGWFPQHLLVKSPDGSLLGCCPLYLKGHSYGEYVFDHQWASVASYMGQNYYPKLQSCVPFTPVTGNRLLVLPGPLSDQVKVLMARGLKSVADTLDVSSLHITFSTDDEHSLLEGEGFVGRMGLQYHWYNKGYENFNDFLLDMRQSKRKNVKQERKCLQKEGLKVQRLTGDDIKSKDWDQFYEFYLNTCDRKWGEAYLNREFFHRMGESMSDRVLLVMAEDAMGDSVAGALNLIGSDALYGRNWGKSFTLNCKHLHFELCYYQAVEFAIEAGLDRVEAGAQGEHKIQRGYLPQPTFSSHYVRIPKLREMVKTALAQEKEEITDTIVYLTDTLSPFKE